MPFADDENIVLDIYNIVLYQHEGLPEYVEFEDDGLVVLIQALLSRRPEDRPTFADLQYDSFFREIDWRKLWCRQPRAPVDHWRWKKDFRHGLTCNDYWPTVKTQDLLTFFLRLSRSWEGREVLLGEPPLCRWAMQSKVVKHLHQEYHATLLFSRTLSTPILHQENGRLRSAAKAVQAKIGNFLSFWIYWPILTCKNSWRQGSWSWKRVSRCRISLEARGPRNWCRREGNIGKYGKCIGL